jgi:hypothetical protein
MSKRKSQFDSEESLAAHVVGWLEQDNWDVYQEVPLQSAGACPDIIAVQGKVTWIIECKLTFGLAVLEQAWGWKLYAHFRSVAVPWPVRNKFACDVAGQYGIGVITVQSCYEGVVISQSMKPAFFRRAASHLVLPQLKPGHKTHAQAGTAHGGRYTKFRATCEAIRAAVERDPGITMKELLDRVKTHYASAATARATLPRRIEDNLVPGVKIHRQGRLIELYPSNYDLSILKDDLRIPLLECDRREGKDG